MARRATTRTATLASGLTVTRSVTARDTADRWTALTIQQSGASARTMARSFDAAGRLVEQSGLGLSAVGFATYDASSGLKDHDYLPLTLGGSLSNAYSYYPGGALAAATLQTPAGRLTCAYTYDAQGQRTRSVVTTAGVTTTTTYTYDDLTLLKLSATCGAASWRLDYLYDEEDTLWGGVYRSPASSSSLSQPGRRGGSLARGGGRGG